MGDPFGKSLGFILYVVGSINSFWSEMYCVQEWSGWNPEISKKIRIILHTSFTLIITQKQIEKR